MHATLLLQAAQIETCREVLDPKDWVTARVAESRVVSEANLKYIHNRGPGLLLATSYQRPGWLCFLFFSSPVAFYGWG